MLKTNKIISEIEAKRKLKDYIFFGSLGIEGVNVKSFQTIFSHIKLDDFINMISVKNFDLLREKLLKFGGIGYSKSESIISYVKDTETRNELLKLIDELTLYPTYSDENKISKGRVVFSGCRPTEEMEDLLTNAGYEPSASWSNSAKVLIIPNSDYTSTKVNKAKAMGIKIVTLGDNPIMSIKTNIIGG